MTLHDTPGLECPSSTEVSGILAAPFFIRAAYSLLLDKKKKNQTPRDESTSIPRNFVLDMGTTSEFDWETAVLDSGGAMVMQTSTVITDMEYIFTTVAENGTAALNLDLPCSDTWYMWGLGWVPTGYSDPPSTFYFSYDLDPPTLWELGAPTSSTASWNWVKAASGSIGDWSKFMAAGSHPLVVEGGESLGSETYDHPALGTIVVTNNSSYVP